MPLITSLFVLLLCAHVLGRLGLRIGLPALAGHLIAGVLLGPSVLGWLTPDAALSAVSDVAVLVVVLTAGLDMRLQHVLEVLRGRGIGALFAGLSICLLGGGALGAAFALPPVQSIVVALCISITALPVALQILRSFDMLNTIVARVAIAGALLADIVVLLMLGGLIELNAIGQQNAWMVALGLAIAKLGGLVGGIVLAQYCCGRLMARRVGAASSANVSSENLAFALLFVLGLGALSELLGFHFAIGAFFGAMMLSNELIGERFFERLGDTCEVLTTSWFGPLFLALQGIQFHLQSLNRPVLIATVVVGAVLLKLISGYVVGRMQRMSAHDAWGVGIVMNARGVMGLVVASIAFRAGLVDAELFSAILLMDLVTTVLTPLMLKRWLARAAACGGESTLLR